MSSVPLLTHPGRAAQRAVLVLGMHRSGTSAVTQALHLLGLDVPGNLIPANPQENPTGFWESADIVAVHQAFLAAAGSDWDDPTPLPAALFQGTEARLCRERLHRLLVRDLADSPLFAIKDPRMCRLMPLWRDLLREMAIEPAVVIPIRHPLDIAASLARRNRFARSASIRLWLSHLVLAERDSRGLSRLFVDYSDFVDDPRRGGRRLHRFLGLPGEPASRRLEAIAAEIQPRHRHHDTATTPGPVEALPPLAAELFAAAQAATRGVPLDEAALERAGTFLDQAYSLFDEGADPARLDQRLRQQIDALGHLSSQWAGQLVETGNCTRALGFIDTVRVHPGGSIEIAGWAIDRRLGHAAEAVVLVVNGTAVAAAPVDRVRADVRVAEAGDGSHLDRRPGFSIFLKPEAAGDFSSTNARVLAFGPGSEALGALDWTPQADRSLAAHFELLLGIERQNHQRQLAELRAGLDQSRQAAEERLREAQAELDRERALGEAALVQLRRDQEAPGADRAALEETLAESAALLTQARADLATAEAVRQTLETRHAALDQRFAALLAERQATLGSTAWAVARLLGRGGRLLPWAGWLARRLRRRRVSPLDARMVIESGLFNPGAYLAAYPDVDGDPLDHFLTHGGAEGRNPSPAFRCADYAKAHQLPAGTNPLLHHLRATLERFRASGCFDPAFYRRTYSDVARSRIDPAWHFLTRGWSEGRCCAAGIDLAPLRRSLGPETNLVLCLESFLDAVATVGDALRPPETFAADWYLARNPDVATAGIPPWRHYLRHGWRERRDPNLMFDTGWYLDRNPDIAAAGINPLLHYLRYGAEEGRDPHPLFDTAFYAEANRAETDRRGALAHYLRVGRGEGRPTRPPRSPLTAASLPAATGPRLLFVLHGLGGGTERHCRDMAALLEAEGTEVWALQSARGERLSLSRWSGGEAPRVYHAATPGEWEALLADLRALRLRHLHCHHFIGFPATILTLPAALGLPYDVTLHDYAWVCPRVTMIGADGRYCRRAEGSGVICEQCLASAGPHEGIALDPGQPGAVAAWQAERARLLRGARRLFVPDSDVAERITALIALPTPPVVRPHPEPVRRIRPRLPVAGERIRVAVIGGISRDKGGDLLLDCAEAARRDGLPLSFEVIGALVSAERARRLPNLTIHGPYRREDLPGLLRRIRCHLALFLPICPETYCYTLSEGLEAGLFPVVTPLGAPARRVRALGWGAVIPPDARPEGINRLLLRSALSHPLPGPALRFGTSYSSLLHEYYDVSWADAPV